MKIRILVTLLALAMATPAFATKWYILMQLSKEEFAQWYPDPVERAKQKAWVLGKIKENHAEKGLPNWWFEAEPLSKPQPSTKVGPSYLVHDPNGAGVWFKQDDKRRSIAWQGDKNTSREAEGKGTLWVYFNHEKIASYDGIMRGGRFVGEVSAQYVKTNQSYRGEILDWSENGRGTMRYPDGRVVSGMWKNGEITSASASNGNATVAVVPVIGEQASAFLGRLGQARGRDTRGEPGKPGYGTLYEFEDSKFGAEQLALFVSGVSGRIEFVYYSFATGMGPDGLPTDQKMQSILGAVAPGRTWTKKDRWIAEDCSATVRRLDGSGEDGVLKDWKAVVTIALPQQRQ